MEWSVGWAGPFREAGKGIGFFRHKSGVIALLVINYEGSIHVRRQKQVLGSG